MQIRQVTIERTYTATIEPDYTVTIDRAGERIAEARWDAKREMIYGDGGALTAAEIAELSAALRATPPRPMTCEEVFDRIGHSDTKALVHWRRLADEGSIHLGGRGRTGEQMVAAALAWDRLPETARALQLAMYHATERELVAAIRKAGIPDRVESPIDAIEALLGPTHPAWYVLPVDWLVALYKEVVERIGG